MKHLLILLPIVFFVSCTRDWKNPLEAEPQPAIEQVALDSQSNIVLYLSIGYGQEYTVTLERKTKGGFERNSYVRLSQAALADTSFDKELDYNFAYRVRVEKNGYSTDYSTEKPFDYVSKILNAPAGLQATTLELQGIKLEWIDRSSKEDGYKIEKNDGSGWVELVSLPANAKSYLHAISRIPSLPLQLSYRVKAFNRTLESQWAEKVTTYSGIGVPTNLRVTDTTFYRLTIEWQDNSNIETGYLIERNKNGGTFTEIAQSNANEIKYIDKITETGRYSYRVRAKKDNLYSLHSNEVSQNVNSVLPVEGLVAYYPFTGSAKDESGSGNNGTVYGAILTTDRFGRSNNAYDFSGNGDYINTNFTPTAIFTISIWFSKSSTQNGNAGLLSTYSGGFNYSGVYYSLSGTHESIWCDGNLVYSLNTSDLSWRHLVIISDGTKVRVYVNANNQLDFSATTRHSNLLVFGDSRYNGRYFTGKIDDVRVYNRAVSETEVETLYHEGGR